MADPDPLQMMTCPYNKAHQVQHYRLHIHLQKCRKQYPNCPKQTCAFDATHIINDVEMDYHLGVCPKRHLMDIQKYSNSDDCRPQVEVQGQPLAPSQLDENWDEEPSTSYKPDPTKKPSHVITKIRGATPSERRKARMEGVKTYKPPSTSPSPEEQ